MKMKCSRQKNRLEVGNRCRERPIPMGLLQFRLLGPVVSPNLHFDSSRCRFGQLWQSHLVGMDSRTNIDER